MWSTACRVPNALQIARSSIAGTAGSPGDLACRAPGSISSRIASSLSALTLGTRSCSPLGRRQPRLALQENARVHGASWRKLASIGTLVQFCECCTGLACHKHLLRVDVGAHRVLVKVRRGPHVLG